MPPKKKDEKAVSSGPLDHFFTTASASSASSRGKAKADSSDDKCASHVPAKRPKRTSTAARKKSRVVSDEGSDIEIMSKPATWKTPAIVSDKTQAIVSDDDSEVELVAPHRVLRRARVVDSDEDNSEPGIVSTSTASAGPSTTSTSAAIEISSDEDCATQRKTPIPKAVLKVGGRTYDKETKRVVTNTRNAKRRADRDDPSGAYQPNKWQKDVEKAPKRIDAYSAFLIKEFDVRLDNFLAVQAILSDSSKTQMETIKSITNTARCQHSAHTIPPEHELWDKLVPVQDLLKVFSSNPLQFNPDPFVANGARKVKK